MNIVEILQAAIQFGASDIHLVVGLPPMIRNVGEMVELGGFPALSAEECKALIYSCLYDSQRAEFERNLELDCSLNVKNLARFRVNVLVQNNGVEAVLRVIPSQLPTAEFLGIGPSIQDLSKLSDGLVLVTGPTGSGKSTTLAVLIDQINRRERRHIITVEDPIEFVHTHNRSVIRQRGVGPHTKSFAEALRHALRQDPDVIMVGEMRDLETISLALTAAETGHLCFGTLHTGDSAQTVSRIIDVYPAEQQQQVRVQLANSLRAVVSQVLLTRNDGQGRIAARELMIVTPAISNLIREGKTHMIPNAIETGGKHHMFTLDQSLAELVRTGRVPVQEALGLAVNPERVAPGMVRQSH